MRVTTTDDLLPTMTQPVSFTWDDREAEELTSVSLVAVEEQDVDW